MKNVALIICLFLLTTSCNVLLQAQTKLIPVQNTSAHVSTLTMQVKVLKQASCTDSEDGSIQVVAQGGQAPYQYIEIKGSEITKRLEVGNTFIKLNPDAYTLKVVDAYGYETSMELILEAVKPAPIAEFEIEKTKSTIKVVNTSFYTGRWSWQINEEVSYEETPILSTTDDFQEVCIVARNGCNAKDIYCETIDVKHELASTLTPTKIENNFAAKKTYLNDFEVTAFPNPTTDKLTVKYSNTNNLINIEVYSMTGKLIQSVLPQSTTQTTLFISNVPVGIYLVKVNGATSTKTLKINKTE